MGLFSMSLSEFGISDFCLVLRELSAFHSGIAVALWSHVMAAELLLAAGQKTDPNELIAYSSFSAPEESSRSHSTGIVESVVLVGQAKKVVFASENQYFSAPIESLSSPIATLGIRNCPIFDLTLNPSRITPLRGNFKNIEYQMSLAAAAISLGLSKASADEALRYSKSRKQGGKEIFHWSEIKMLLAKIFTRVQTGELALERACQWAELQKTGWEAHALSVALFIQEEACEITSDGIQVLGGAGYTTEFRQEERFRDAFHLQHLSGLLPARKLQLVRLLET